MHATLYFEIHEINSIHFFPQLKYYRWYIDDVVAIWEPQQDAENHQEWKCAHDSINFIGNGSRKSHTLSKLPDSLI